MSKKKKKKKKDCCRKYDRKSKVCKSCPFVIGFSKKQRKTWLEQQRRKAA